MRKVLLYLLAVIGLSTIGAVVLMAWLLYPRWEPTGADPLPTWQP